MPVFAGKSPNKVPTWYCSRSTAIIPQRLTDYRHCAMTLRYGRRSPARRTDLYTLICIHGIFRQGRCTISPGAGIVAGLTRDAVG